MLVCIVCYMFPIVRECLLKVSVDESEQVCADQCIIVVSSKQHVPTCFVQNPCAHLSDAVALRKGGFG